MNSPLTSEPSLSTWKGRVSQYPNTLPNTRELWDTLPWSSLFMDMIGLHWRGLLRPLPTRSHCSLSNRPMVPRGNFVTGIITSTVPRTSCLDVMLGLCRIWLASVTSMLGGRISCCHSTRPCMTRWKNWRGRLRIED